MRVERDDAARREIAAEQLRWCATPPSAACSAVGHLRARKYSPMDGQFARDAENPIAADAVVIDEVGARDPREMAMTIRSKR